MAICRSNKVPNWIVSVPYSETGQFEAGLMNDVLEAAVLTCRETSDEQGVEKVLRAVVPTGTHPMYRFPGAEWRRADGEVFEDDRFGPHIVEEFKIQPILGVARPWCTGLRGTPVAHLRDEVRERIFALLFDVACRKAEERGLPSSVRNKLAQMVRHLVTLLDPFHLEDHQVDRISECSSAAALERAASPSVGLPWKSDELKKGTFYGLSVPLLNPERELWLDFRVAAEELVRAWPDKGEEISKLLSDLQARLIGSPLPILPSGLRFGNNLPDCERALWKDLLGLRDLCDEVDGAGEDAEYLLSELRKTVHQIIALRRYRYTPKWDVLLTLYEGMSAGKRKRLGVLSRLHSNGVGKAIEQASQGTGLSAYDWSIGGMNAIREDTLWVVLESESILGFPSMLRWPQTSPVVVVLYDLEWDWLAQSGKFDMSLFQVMNVSIPSDPIKPSLPLPDLTLPTMPPRAVPTPTKGTEGRRSAPNASSRKLCVVLGDKMRLPLGSRQRVWVRPPRGLVREKLIRDLARGDLLILRKPQNCTRVSQKIREALRPARVKEFQRELCQRMKELGLTNREVWRRLLMAGSQIDSENVISLWRTGRSWGPRRAEDLEKLADILDSAWLREHWRELAGMIQIQDEELKYKRIVTHFLRKAAQHSPHWNEDEKLLLENAKLSLEDLRGCFELTGVVSVEHEDRIAAA